MTRFENKVCPVCRAPFQGNADVVVCPICGTPHHRVCYLSNGKCALEDLHKSGFVWKGRLPDELEPAAPNAVQDASTDPHRAEYPSGTPKITEEELLGNADAVIDMFVKSAGDKTLGEDGVSMKELVAYSASSVFHYGRAFSAFRGKIDGKKHKAFFNVCSGMFAPAFQFYRKMNVFGVIVLLMLLLPFLFYTMAVATGDVQLGTAAMYIYNVVLIIEMVLLCAFGDYIYYRHAIKQILKIREEFKGKTDTDEYFAALNESGRPSFARAFLGYLAMAFLEVCAMVLPGVIMQ